jgi:HEAT repeat protein
MDQITHTHLDNLWSQDRDLQNEAFTAILKKTELPAAWAYEAWDRLKDGLRHPDNHVRAIAAQVLCNLAQSDPEQRMLEDFQALLMVTKDERFVTARHCLQALWKVGVTGEAQRQAYLAGLGARFAECAAEKNCTLIRYDILQSFRKVYDVVQDERIRARALELIESEPDPKYRHKYSGLWKK